MKETKFSDKMLSEYLAAARKDAKLTQDEVAASIGCMQRTVSQWETGGTRIKAADAAIVLDLYEEKSGNKYSLDTALGR